MPWPGVFFLYLVASAIRGIIRWPGIFLINFSVKHSDQTARPINSKLAGMLRGIVPYGMTGACSDDVDDVTINDVTDKNVFLQLPTKRMKDFDASWRKRKVGSGSIGLEGVF